ncbi:MAG: hypothetical protein M0Z53_11845 [Thermaerobacter sp.]|nr:hypothetical protein [Thermaerobacter sp.]
MASYDSRMGRLLQLLEGPADERRLQAGWILGRHRVHRAMPRLAALIRQEPLATAERQHYLRAWLELATWQEARELLMDDTLADDLRVTVAREYEADQVPQWHASLGIAAGSGLQADGLVEAAGWVGQEVPAVFLPQESLARCHIARLPAWPQVMAAGGKRMAGPRRGFEEFWTGHIQRWASRWLQQDRLSSQYAQALASERQLQRWLGRAETEAVAPVAAKIKIALTPALPAEEALERLAWGLAEVTERSRADTFAAWWDSIWSSWAAALQYDLYQLDSNWQITKWHLGGLTADLLLAMT